MQGAASVLPPHPSYLPPTQYLDSSFIIGICKSHPQMSCTQLTNAASYTNVLWSNIADVWGIHMISCPHLCLPLQSSSINCLQNTHPECLECVGTILPPSPWLPASLVYQQASGTGPSQATISPNRLPASLTQTLHYPS